MAQHGTSGQAPEAASPPAGPLAGDLPLSAERLRALEPKLRALLLDFQQLEALAGPEIEPWYDPTQMQEADDAR
jgi:hypothetical protein